MGVTRPSQRLNRCGVSRGTAGDHQPPLSRVLAHQVAVARAVPTANLEHLVRVAGQVERGDEVGEQVIDADWLRLGAHPARADHHGEPLDQGPDHLEREAARADDDRGAEFDDRHAALAQRLAGLEAALQVLAQRAIVVGESAKVDDAAQPGPSRGATEGAGCEDIGLAVVAVRRARQRSGRPSALSAGRSRPPM